jgi:hypothetical protein
MTASIIAVVVATVGAQDLYMKIQDLYEISLYGITAMMA